MKARRSESFEGTRAHCQTQNLRRTGFPAPLAGGHNTCTASTTTHTFLVAAELRMNFEAYPYPPAVAIMHRISSYTLSIALAFFSLPRHIPRTGAIYMVKYFYNDSSLPRTASDVTFFPSSCEPPFPIIPNIIPNPSRLFGFQDQSTKFGCCLFVSIFFPFSNCACAFAN